MLSKNDTVLIVTISNKYGTKADFIVLEEVCLDSGSFAAKVSCTVYIGILNCSIDSSSNKVLPVPGTSAVEEMFVLIIPACRGLACLL